ncbi:MAG TPA: CarD family transcriptional regulator [Methylomirabilota bacterium]|jgi:CarD family transcriptional regulator|nr:CarD family transcriptional regulator [Methylomirabilota bacterium]
MATKVKTNKKAGSKAAHSKRPAERTRPAASTNRTRSSAGKRPTAPARGKPAPKGAAAKAKPAPRPAKAAPKPKAIAKPAKAPAKRPSPRPHAEAKPSAKPERVAKPAPKAAAPRPAPAREPAPAKPAEGAARADLQPSPAQSAKPAANGAAKTAAAALKARLPGQENVRKLPERAGPAPEPFSEGDFVVYPTHGVGRVVAIETQQIAGISLPLIVITFDKDRMTLRVPVAKAHNSGLRKLSSRKVMDTALATLKGRSRVKRTMWSRRAQEYEAKINSGDPVSIAEVVRDLHRGSDQPDQSYSERQIYQAALDRLARELAAVERIDEQAAAQRLEEMLKAA